MPSDADPLLCALSPIIIISEESVQMFYPPIPQILLFYWWIQRQNTEYLFTWIFLTFSQNISCLQYSVNTRLVSIFIDVY